MLTFVLGIIVGLLLGWWIWGRGAAQHHAGADHSPGPSQDAPASAPSRLDRPSGSSLSDPSAGDTPSGATPAAGFSSTTMATPVAGAVLASSDRSGLEAEAEAKAEAVDETPSTDAETTTPHLDSGDAIAPTGVPDVGGPKEPAKDLEPAEDLAGDGEGVEPLTSGGAAPVGTVYVSDNTPRADEAGTLTPAALVGAGDGPAVETASSGPAPSSATGPLIDEDAQARARAIGIAPAEIGRHGDDLKRVRGIGPKLEAMLHDLGVYTFAQMAAWSEAEIDAVDGNLTAFKGRIRRDDWRAQARDLQGG